jgi:hypothetical protein
MCALDVPFDVFSQVNMTVTVAVTASVMSSNMLSLATSLVDLLPHPLQSRANQINSSLFYAYVF